MKQNRIFKAVFSALILYISKGFSLQAQNTALISSSCSIDWTKQEFSSQVLFNVEKAGINMPSGKNSALYRIALEMPKLIKDQLLSIFVDSYLQLGDTVLNEDITLEQLTRIIEDGKRTPGVFTDSSSVIRTNHLMDLRSISSLMVHHKIPYTAQEPIVQVPSRAFTGIIIDARGQLPVHGEFVKSSVHPCFFPRIWNDKMDLVYERNMTDSSNAKKNSIVAYNYSDDEKIYRDRIGVDPLRILARKVYGQNRTDPVISYNDALKILTVPENLKLLEEGRVVILLDKDNLIYDVKAPVKDELYYTALNTVRKLLYVDKVPDVEIYDTYKGILFQIDLKFYPDSPVLLPEEKERIAKVAQMLGDITKNDEFTILVEGHAADIGRPLGEMQLSIERAKSVIESLLNFGLRKDLFSFQGYGSTQPIADNSTPEGRAQNRRVDITARPKATYIKRDWN
ncbi:OmpA family protein [Treponema parvum]|uniref:OmpA family protein n=1 Tax=Treponema parvum TaxID=138851 RepID=A0A975ICH8_9SPIR|nr:OmpA family protein [Treponema parvum]QTQ11114.1 OmpA family protein [Treponema parvum]